MREFELIIDEGIRKGLSPERTIPMNEDWLWQALGYRVDKAGLEGYVICDDNPLTGVVNIDYSWPFPQFIVGERYNFLISRDSTVDLEDNVYLISDNYVATHIFDIDQLTFGIGTLMEVADFGEYAFMTNGVIMIYWNVGINDWHEIVASVTVPMMRTICNFKGQAIGGNIVSAWPSAANPQCDETYYVWSRIGEFDFTITSRNEEGFRRDPYGGEVYHVRRLGDQVVGYSSKGITLMTPVSEPAATFGFSEVDDVGLINMGAMDGNLKRHVYVGSDFILREITSEGVKEFGYYRYMKELEGEDIIVRYDRIKKDFYIGNSAKTYLLSPYGLTEVPQHPSALWTMSNYSEETIMLPNTVDTYTPSITSSTFDFGYRGQKTIFSVESDTLITLDPSAVIGWMDALGVWNYTTAVSLNNEGIASIIASSNEFVVKINCKDVTFESPIRYIKVRYKMTDLRGIRGIYAPPPRGQ